MISLICSTYNQPEFLKMALDSIHHQKFDTDQLEVIIADDGSDSPTKNIITEFQRRFNFSLKHITHPRKGWQKSQIHNKAIKASLGKLLIFVDGDCILDPYFVQDHARIFSSNEAPYVLMGRRVDLGPVLTSQLSLDNYRPKLLSYFPSALYWSQVRGDTKNALRHLRLNPTWIRKLTQADLVPDLLGSNFSVPRETFYSINGFNESITRGEDGDIFVRLRNFGVKLIGKKYFAPQFHLWHPRGDYTWVDQNYEKLLKTHDYVWCEKGLASNHP